MNGQNVTSFLESLKYVENLNQVISTGIAEAKRSRSAVIHEKDSSEDGRLPSEHYFKLFQFRCKNPNGVALNTLGMRESMENLKQHSGLLELIVFEFDEGACLSVWVSDQNSAIACLFYPRGSMKNRDQP